MMKDNTSLNEGIFVNQVGNPTTFVYWSASNAVLCTWICKERQAHPIAHT